MKKSTVKTAFAAVATVGACLFSSASFAEDLTALLVNHGIPLSSKYPTQYYARNPWDLKAFEGRLYIGSGNSANAGPNKNAGPVPIMSYDPATGNCVEELVIQQEQIDVFRILDDGGLYIPGHDPKGGNGSVYLRAPGASGENAWKQFNNLTGCEHCYDAIMFDGKFIASGSNLWVSPDASAANVAAFTAYNITGRRYAMLRFPNALYAVGTATVGGTVGTLTYAESFGIDRLPKDGAFAPVENAGSKTRRYADRQCVFPGIDDMVVRKEYCIQRPVSFGSRVIYIGGLNHNDHQLLPLAAFSAVDGEVCFTATRIELPEGAVPWDTLVAGDKAYLLWTTKSGDKFVNHVSESEDGLAFTEIFRFTADSFARSFEYLKRRFYFGLGAEDVDIFSPYSAANNSLLTAASGTILSCPYDLNLPEDDPVVPLGTTTIILTAPENGATYDTHLQALKKYLANSDARSEFPSDEILAAKDDDQGNHYVHNAWFLNLLDEASAEQATYKPFTWEKTGDITDIVVQYSEDADFTDGKVLNEAYCRDNATATRPLNLKLATKYWWRVKAKDENGDEVVSDVRTFTTKGDAPRIIGTLGFNMRDLGGGKNAEGLTVRQGLILRGKCPMARVNGEAGWNDEKMTEESYREFYVNKHHIRTELDFRSADEALEHQTKYDEIEISRIGIEHFNMEIYPYHYGHALTSSNICQAVKMLAEGTHYPVYFNCAVGSDRTGTFGTIIDGIVGRDDQWFYDNYELPSFDSGLARLRYNRKASGMFEYLQPRNPGEHFRDRVVQYLLGIGVTREEIRAIRAAMLELPAEGDARELKSAKAVYTEADQTLTLRYDDQDYSGVDGQLQCGLSRGGWVALTNDVRHIVFAPSFKDYRVESCLQWFEDFKVLEDVTGLGNFDTSLTTTLRGMFTSCSALTEFDFSGHDLPKCTNLGNMFYKCRGLKSVDFTGVATTNVTDFYRMFSGCSSLATIYASEEFDASGYTDLTKEVFKGCSKLVGGAGTKFSSEHVNVEYARLDNPADGRPGYFTDKNAPVNPPVDPDPPVNPPVNPPDNPDPPEEPEEETWDDPDADLPEDAELAARAVRIGDTIRFYYDKKSHARDGAEVSVIPVAGTRTWHAPTADNFEITNVVFYASFKDFKPQSMSGWFYYYRALKNVIGLQNIDTSDVTNMSNLFRCKSGNNGNITELDLSTWDTRNCKNMSYMFARLSNLKTISVGDNFVVTQVTSSTSMFANCYVLTGEKGTVAYINTKTTAHELDKTCAKVDGGADDPGYFTYKAPSVDPIIVKPELGSSMILTGDAKSFGISVSNPVVGAAYTVFVSTTLDGEFTAEADSTVYAAGELVLDFAVEDDKPQKFAKIVVSTKPYKAGDPLPEE